METEGVLTEQAGNHDLIHSQAEKDEYQFTGAEHAEAQCRPANPQIEGQARPKFLYDCNDHAQRTQAGCDQHAPNHADDALIEQHPDNNDLCDATNRVAQTDQPEAQIPLEDGLKRLTRHEQRRNKSCDNEKVRQRRRVEIGRQPAARGSDRQAGKNSQRKRGPKDRLELDPVELAAEYECLGQAALGDHLCEVDRD